MAILNITPVFYRLDHAGKYSPAKIVEYSHGNYFLSFSQSMNNENDKNSIIAAGDSMLSMQAAICVSSSDPEAVALELGIYVIGENNPDFDGAVNSLSDGIRKKFMPSKIRGTSSTSKPAAKTAPAVVPAETSAKDNKVSKIINEALASFDLRPVLSAEIGNLGAKYANEVAKDKVSEIITSCADQLAALGGGGAELRVNNQSVNMPDLKHMAFNKVLAIMAAGMNVYLWGPAGTGKSYLAKQIAESLGLNFFCQQKAIEKYDLCGYTSATGEYVATSFYRAYSGGGLFLFDEMDSSSADALVWLNTSLENGYCEFPGVGIVKKHPEFKFIAAGNSCGRGADSSYTCRDGFDLSTLGRFAVVKLDYSPEIVQAYAAGDQDLISFCEKVREYAEKYTIPVTAGVREIRNIKKLESATENGRRMFEDSEILNMAMFKNLPSDSLNIIRNNVSCGGRWLVALGDLCK